MNKKWGVTSYILFAILLIVIVLVSGSGCFQQTETPPGLNLSISENISPDVQVVVLDNDKNVISSLGIDLWFFLQQRGLVKGTIYGFRILDEGGNVIKPVYETFVAKTSTWVEQNKYYHGLVVGEYIIELLTIKNDSGIIVARTNFSIIDLEAQRAALEKIIIDNCSSLMSEPLVDANGWSRDGKISRCVANIALESRSDYACDLLFKLFNVTDYDGCIQEYVIITGDISVCDKCSMPKARGFCKAKATKDWTECRNISCDFSCTMENLDTQKDLCIQWYAIENGNASLCNEIKSTAYNMKEICFNITTQT